MNSLAELNYDTESSLYLSTLCLINYQPNHLSSQVFCIFLFLCAASLFGTIIAQVNEIVADLTTKKKDLDRVLEAYLTLTPRLSQSFGIVIHPLFQI
jgi:hypothetical protein